MENRAKRELARKRFIVHSVLCALVPPLGMLLVWRSRYESKKKLLMRKYEICVCAPAAAD